MLHANRMHLILQPSSPRWVRGTTVDFPLIQAVLESRQDGHTLANDDEEPSVVLVVTKFGFTYAFGEEADEEQWRDLVGTLFTHENLKHRYLLWYDPPPACRYVLTTLPDEVVKKRTRTRFKFDSKRQDNELRDEGLPAKVEVRKVDRQILAKLSRFRLDIGARFWRSEQDFLDQGFGFVAEIDDEIASICYSACVVNGLAEIDVVTLDNHRGQGLAGAVCKAFIGHCRREGITPTWDCFDYNKASCRLAAGLGFEAFKTYPFYSLNT
jgi:RimJ/RimL family protein N-acetyltransferase